MSEEEKIKPDEPQKEAPDKYEALLKELNEYKDKYLRQLAELENSRKRLQKEKEESIRFAIERTISEFLLAIDNFENALKFASQGSEEIQKWAVGFQMILTQFREIIHDHGIVSFHVIGTHFDPNEHEVVEIVETNEYPDNTVIEEFIKGYKSSSRIIRPAHVKIARRPEQKESQEKDQTKQDEEKI